MDWDRGRHHHDSHWNGGVAVGRSVPVRSWFGIGGGVARAPVGGLGPIQSGPGRASCRTKADSIPVVRRGLSARRRVGAGGARARSRTKADSIPMVSIHVSFLIFSLYCSLILMP